MRLLKPRWMAGKEQFGERMSGLASETRYDLPKRSRRDTSTRSISRERVE